MYVDVFRVIELSLMTTQVSKNLWVTSFIGALATIRAGKFLDSLSKI
jgi:hypothetical protein